MSPLTLAMIRSEIHLEQTLVWVSRSAYQIGNKRDGDMALAKAERVHSRIMQFTKELPGTEIDSQSILCQLGRLEVVIHWLALNATQLTK